MGFFQRIGRGAKKVGKYREKLEKWQDERAQREIERAKVHEQKYKAQAAMYRAAAARKEAQERYSKATMGSFGGQKGVGMVRNDFFGQQQPQKPEVKKTKKRKPSRRTIMPSRRTIRQSPQPKGIRGLDFM